LVRPDAAVMRESPRRDMDVFASTVCSPRAAAKSVKVVYENVRHPRRLIGSDGGW
jgi:hypothetical protein